MKQVERDFFLKPTLEILKEIIGMKLISEVDGIKTGGTIVEAEAYLGENDPGSFAYGGKKTKKSIPLYGEEGRIFVYLNYGMYYLLNIITEPQGKAGAILIRAILPEMGVEKMMERRKRKDVKNLTNGPGKLCMALSIGKEHNGFKIYEKESPIKLFYGKKFLPEKLKYTGRIGISKGKKLPYRIVLDNFNSKIK